MRAWRGVTPRLLLVVLVVVLVAGCDDGARDARPPRVGATEPSRAAVPERPMGHLERPVAERLGPRLERQGLTLDYVDCPQWPGRVPATIVCAGYVDGVVTDVQVRLSEGPRGRVTFDAWLGAGIVATSRLVRRLEAAGWHTVDCGSAPAYPARPGLEIVCRVHEGGSADYVVATVTDRRGAVRIAEY